LKNNENIKVVRLPCAIEEIANIITQLIGLTIVYLLFKFIGELVIGDEFSPDILLSMVVLPAIMVLKELHQIIQPYFVKVSLKGDSLSVKQGILTTYEDSLTLENVENIEMVTTLLGKCLNYSTIRLYAFGSWVIIPNVKNPLVLKAKINKIVKSKKKKSMGSESMGSE